MLSVRTADRPRIPDAERLTFEDLGQGFWKASATFGYMEQPSIPRILGMARKGGFKVDINATSFFLGKRTVVPAANSRFPRWQAKLFIALVRNAAAASDVYKLPPGRVIEMGSQVTI